MRNWLVLCSLAVALGGCGQWKGDGTDEAIPDVIGLTTGLNRAFGVQPAILFRDQADEDIRLNRPSDEEKESGHARELPFTIGH
jgi:hypothetical protein